MKYVTLLFACLAAYCAAAQNTASAAARSGNPVFPGWYADPEGVVFGDTYWIYPTYSADYDEQTFMDAFSSKDLVHWQKHPRIVSNDEVMHAALSRIDATPAQERVIVGEIEKLQERMYGARSRLKDARGDLSAAVRGPVLDDAALGAVLGRVDASTGEARSAMLDALRAIHEVLDDRQRALVADLIDRNGGGFWRHGPYR